MKLLFISAFLFMVGIYNLSAQLKDSIRIKNRFFLEKPVINSSLFQYEKSFMNHELLLQTDRIKYSGFTFKFDLPVKKTYVLNGDYTKLVAPLSIIMLGALTHSRKSFEELNPDFDMNGNPQGHKTHIDDYLRYAPYAGIYALDLLGVKAKHNFMDRTFVMLTSYLIMDKTVNIMKNNVPTWRPNGSDLRSFPSSHTSTAFVGAHIMFREYKDSSFWLSLTGYAMATTTGVLRMVNKCHSFSDVLTGAGIGILSVELGYLLLPVFQKIWRFKDSGKKLVLLPSFHAKGADLKLAYCF